MGSTIITSNSWDGDVEEFRIRDGVMTDGEIVTQYNNQNSSSTFYSFATAETYTDDWYNDAWNKRIRVSSDNLLVPGRSDLTDFPNYIDLGRLSEEFWDNVKSDGSDIVVTSSNGTTKVAREISNFNQISKTGSLFFKGTIQWDEDTHFFIYFGNAAASEANDTATWNSNYVSVHHLDETTAS